MLMKNTTKNSILIVDTDSESLAVTKTALQGLNCSFIIAFTPQEALQYLAKYKFALIILNIKTDVTDGLGLVRLMRSWEKLKYMPILVMSEWHGDDMELVNSINTLDGVDYIPKPINPVILRAKVKAFMDVAMHSTLITQENSSQPSSGFDTISALSPNHN